MNYRHIYHAGGFSDVIKHLILISTLKKLIRKDNPLSVLDCFAGIGLYNLHSVNALKTKESSYGILKILDFINKSPITLPSLLAEYVTLVKSFPSNLYPGSPLIISHFLRSADQLIAIELHPEDYITLKNVCQNNTKNNVNVHKLDAYLALKAFLPFKNKRGLIFIDPAFETKDEFDKLLNGLTLINQRAKNNCIILWYPIKDNVKIKNFYRLINMIGFSEILKIELQMYNLANSKTNILNKFDMLYQCGVLIINPLQIKDELKENLQFITREIYHNNANFNIELLD